MARVPKGCIGENTPYIERIEALEAALRQAEEALSDATPLVDRWAAGFLSRLPVSRRHHAALAAIRAALGEPTDRTLPTGQR